MQSCHIALRPITLHQLSFIKKDMGFHARHNAKHATGLSSETSQVTHADKEPSYMAYNLLMVVQQHRCTQAAFTLSMKLPPDVLAAMSLLPTELACKPKIPLSVPCSASRSSCLSLCAAGLLLLLLVERLLLLLLPLLLGSAATAAPAATADVEAASGCWDAAASVWLHLCWACI